MKFTVTKAQVVRALETEPILPGTFVSSGYDKCGYNNNFKCPVCAVGSILSSTRDQHFLDAAEANYYLLCIVEHYHGCKLDYMDSVIGELLAKERWLSALSVLCESISDNELLTNSHKYLDNEFANPEFRKLLIDFVDTNFPQEFEIDTEASDSL